MHMPCITQVGISIGEEVIMYYTIPGCAQVTNSGCVLRGLHVYYGVASSIQETLKVPSNGLHAGA